MIDLLFPCLSFSLLYSSHAAVLKEINQHLLTNQIQGIINLGDSIKNRANKIPHLHKQLCYCCHTWYLGLEVQVLSVNM